MITVTVLYPAADADFDADYYTSKHLPLVQERLSPAIQGIDAQIGVAGGAPDTPPPFKALCHLHFASADDFNEAFAPHAEEIMGDVANYTTIAPVFQISEFSRI